MKRLNKLAAVFCVAAMALTAMTGCEGSAPVRGSHHLPRRAGGRRLRRRRDGPAAGPRIPRSEP